MAYCESIYDNYEGEEFHSQAWRGVVSCQDPPHTCEGLRTRLEEEAEKRIWFQPYTHVLNYLGLKHCVDQWESANDAFKETHLIAWHRYPLFQTSLAS